jgi:hypothetical protein
MKKYTSMSDLKGDAVVSRAKKAARKLLTVFKGPSVSTALAFKTEVTIADGTTSILYAHHIGDSWTVTLYNSQNPNSGLRFKLKLEELQALAELATNLPVQPPP